EMLGEVELGSHRVDGDDASGSGDRSAVDARKTDAAAADDRNRFSRSHIGGIEDGSRSRGNATAEQRSAIEGHLIADFHAGVFVNEHLLCEGRQVQKLKHVLPVLGEPRFVGSLSPYVRTLAAREVASEAVFAATAKGAQAGDDVITWLYRVHF